MEIWSSHHRQTIAQPPNRLHQQKAPKIVSVFRNLVLYNWGLIGVQLNCPKYRKYYLSYSPPNTPVWSYCSSMYNSLYPIWKLGSAKHIALDFVYHFNQDLLSPTYTTLFQNNIKMLHCTSNLSNWYAWTNTRSHIAFKEMLQFNIVSQCVIRALVRVKLWILEKGAHLPKIKQRRYHGPWNYDRFAVCSEQRLL